MWPGLGRVSLGLFLPCHKPPVAEGQVCTGARASEQSQKPKGWVSSQGDVAQSSIPDLTPSALLPELGACGRGKGGLGDGTLRQGRQGVVTAEPPPPGSPTTLNLLSGSRQWTLKLW